MKTVTKEKIDQLIKSKNEGPYTSIIQQLEKGAALCIEPQEWNKRTSIPYYFHGKFNRGQKTVRVLKLGGYYYVIRL